MQYTIYEGELDGGGAWWQLKIVQVMEKNKIAT